MPFSFPAGCGTSWCVPELQERSNLLRHVGAATRRLRVEKRMSQQKLSELADLDLRTIQRIEAGKIDVLLRTIDKIRKALNCEWNDLLPKEN